MSPTPSSHDGTLHIYTRNLVAFEHKPSTSTSTSTSSPPPTNILLWIGGLGGGLLTVPYTSVLAAHLPVSWRIVEVLLSSAYKGWGTATLTQDAGELAACVQYFRRLLGERGKGEGRVVLMGHSTGCQDVMEYLVGPGAEQRPQVQGAILQAGISDREAMLEWLGSDVYNHSVQVAREWVAEGRGEDVLPLSVTGDVFGAPASARRWLSLASPDMEGEDDFFSSDLPEEKLEGTFGRVGRETPLLLLYSGSDQYVPAHVDKGGLVRKWTEIVKEGRGAVDGVNGGVVRGASHGYEGDKEEVVMDMVDRVTGYLQRLGRGDFA